MRSPLVSLVAMLAALVASDLEGTALAQTAPPATAVSPGRVHRLSFGVATLSNQAWSAGTPSNDGAGAAMQLGYDLFLTPAHAVGLVTGAAVDYGSYGLDADAMTWTEVGPRYTYLHMTSADEPFVPFASAGVMVGRTGGELARHDWMTSLAADLGVELRAYQNVSFDLRLVDRIGLIFRADGLWHNSVGAMLSMSVHFPH